MKIPFQFIIPQDELFFNAPFASAEMENICSVAALSIHDYKDTFTIEFHIEQNIILFNSLELKKEIASITR